MVRSTSDVEPLGLSKAVEVCVRDKVVEESVVPLGLITTYEERDGGSEVKGDSDGEGERGGDEGCAGSWVIVLIIVFVGSDSSTVFVDVMKFVERETVLAEAVTVMVFSDVCVTVCTFSTIVAGDVTAEPPSTATTEYGIRL